MKTIAARLTVIGLFLSALTIGGIGSAEGAPITFTYSGTVSYSDLPGLFPEGTPFSISYTFNSDAQATLSIPGEASYQSSIVNSTVTIGNMMFSQPNPGVEDPHSSIGVIRRQVIGGNPLSQRYSAEGSSMGSLSPTIDLTAREWAMTLTYEAPEFSNFDLPLIQPSLAHAIEASASLRFCEPLGSCLPTRVVAALDSGPPTGCRTALPHRTKHCLYRIS